MTFEVWTKDRLFRAVRKISGQHGLGSGVGLAFEYGAVEQGCERLATMFGPDEMVRVCATRDRFSYFHSVPEAQQTLEKWRRNNAKAGFTQLDSIKAQERYLATLEKVR